MSDPLPIDQAGAAALVRELAAGIVERLAASCRLFIGQPISVVCADSNVDVLATESHKTSLANSTWSRVDLAFCLQCAYDRQDSRVKNEENKACPTTVGRL